MNVIDLFSTRSTVETMVSQMNPNEVARAETLHHNCKDNDSVDGAFQIPTGTVAVEGKEDEDGSKLESRSNAANLASMTTPKTVEGATVVTVSAAIASSPAQKAIVKMSTSPRKYKYIWDPTVHNDILQVRVWWSNICSLTSVSFCSKLFVLLFFCKKMVWTARYQL